MEVQHARLSSSFHVFMARLPLDGTSTTVPVTGTPLKAALECALSTAQARLLKTRFFVPQSKPAEALAQMKVKDVISGHKPGARQWYFFFRFFRFFISQYIGCGLRKLLIYVRT